MAQKRPDTAEGAVVPDSGSICTGSGNPDASRDGMEDTVCISLSAIQAQPQEGVPCVQVISGRSAAKVFPLSNGPVAIGRAEECEIPLDDGDISRRHATVTAKPDGTCLLTDGGSRNGTWVKGKRVREILLADGDKFQLGSTVVLKFVIQDQLEQECLQQLYENATRDPLTGIFNKKYVVERVVQEFAYCKRHAVPLAVLLFDIDHFKQINDTYGHTPAGDSVLTRLAGLVAGSVRTEDVLGRFGGEEFLLVCRGNDRIEAARLAERLRRQIENTAFAAKTLNGVRVNIPVRISLGVAVSTGENYADPQALMSAADKALYEAKRGGRNRVVCDVPPGRPTAPMISSPSRPKLGNILVRMGRVTKDQLKIALERQKNDPGAGALGTLLISMGFCTEVDVAAALAAQYGVDTTRLQDPDSADVASEVPRERGPARRPSQEDTLD
jgi:diguanylate cyclase (GGDEF)-like protein